MTISIRPASLDDILAILEIENKTNQMPWTEAQFISSMEVGHYSVVLQEENNILGFANKIDEAKYKSDGDLRGVSAMNKGNLVFTPSKEITKGGKVKRSKKTRKNKRTKKTRKNKRTKKTRKNKRTKKRRRIKK